MSPGHSSGHRQEDGVRYHNHGAAQHPHGHAGRWTALVRMVWIQLRSALAANGLAASAFVVTNTSAAAGALTWLFASWIKGKPSTHGNGERSHRRTGGHHARRGLCRYIAALVIGGVAGVLCYAALLFRVGRGLDESCDAWAVHGMGGLWGAIATGIFATASVNSYHRPSSMETFISSWCKSLRQEHL